MPRRDKSDRYLRAFQAGDFILAAGSFLGASFLLAPVEFWATFQVEPAAALAPEALTVAAVLIFLRLAVSYKRLTSFERLQQVSAALGAAFLLEGLLSYAKVPWILAFPVMAYASVLCAVLLPAWFLAYRYFFPQFPPPQKYLLVGDDPALAEVERSLSSQPRRFQAAGPVPAARMRQAVEELDPDEIVLGVSGVEAAPAADALLDLRLAGIAVQDAAAAYENALHRVSLGHLRPSRVLFGKLGPSRRNMAIQAIYSNLGGLLALVATSPLLIAIFAALKLTAPATPAVEQEQCAGLYGIPFSLLRFQSRTWLGGWLARFGLARLPQLLNVVRGEMSLVGPRPERLEYIEPLQQRIPFYMQRLAVKPGLTGWAQVHGVGSSGPRARDAARSNTLLELEYDLYYIECLSPAFDFEIVLTSLIWRPAAPRAARAPAPAAELDAQRH